jgi:hypothetical protein
MGLSNTAATALPYGTTVTPESAVAQKQLLMRKSFGALLFCATVVPYLVGFSHMMKFSKLHPLQDWILLLASIHVPMTMYLFTDPAIRTQVRNGPIKFIVVPILLFAVCLLFFLASTRDIMQHKANVLTFFLVSVLSWNLWHFGKQNIGVYAYYRLSQSTGGMLPIERRLLYIGAFLGAISVSYLGLKGYQPQYSTDTFGYWNNMAGYVSVSGKYLQYIVSMFSAVYIIYNRERFTGRHCSVPLQPVFL